MTWFGTQARQQAIQRGCPELTSIDLLCRRAQHKRGAEMGTEKYKQALIKLVEVQAKSLTKHGAFEIQAERDFVGYIGQESDGRYFNDIYKYGVHYGKIYDENIEKLKQRAFETFTDK